MKIEVERHAGYLEALRQADVESDPKIIAQGDLSQTSGYQTALDFLSLSMPPTAISCINDRTAIGAIHAAHERRLTVGKDVAIAGLAYFSPSLIMKQEAIRLSNSKPN